MKLNALVTPHKNRCRSNERPIEEIGGGQVSEKSDAAKTIRPPRVKNENVSIGASEGEKIMKEYEVALYNCEDIRTDT